MGRPTDAQMAAVGAAADQAWQDWIDGVDDLVKQVRELGLVGSTSPFTKPQLAMRTRDALEHQSGGNYDMALFNAANYIAELVMRVAAQPEEKSS